jgi:hypothetical protein
VTEELLWTSAQKTEGGEVADNRSTRRRKGVMRGGEREVGSVTLLAADRGQDSYRWRRSAIRWRRRCGVLGRERSGAGCSFGPAVGMAQLRTGVRSAGAFMVREWRATMSARHGVWRQVETGL